LKDLPNDTIPSGMGNLTINFYSTLNYKFYLPEKDKIFLKNIIDEKTQTNIGTSYTFFI